MRIIARIHMHCRTNAEEFRLLGDPSNDTQDEHMVTMSVIVVTARCIYTFVCTGACSFRPGGRPKGPPPGFAARGDLAAVISPIKIDMHAGE